MRIEYRPIGTVHSPFRSPDGMPVQASRSENAPGTVVLNEEFKEGLTDLDGFSHIVLVCHLHLSRPFKLKVTPFLDDVPHGLFATRAPARPNPIGVSVVALEKIEGNTLYIRGVDLIDGTPLLDIKPWVGEFDEPVETRFGWLGEARKRQGVADARFAGRRSKHTGQ
jgi:tRNA-Thr(GGU) m(6)t(6)A37 methyltransferase TsaA